MPNPLFTRLFGWSLLKPQVEVSLTLAKKRRNEFCILLVAGSTDGLFLWWLHSLLQNSQVLLLGRPSHRHQLRPKHQGRTKPWTEPLTMTLAPLYPSPYSQFSKIFIYHNSHHNAKTHHILCHILRSLFISEFFYWEAFQTKLASLKKKSQNCSI